MELIGTKMVLIEQAMQALLDLKDGIAYSLEIKEEKKKRSRDSNSYYWALIGLFADWAEVSKTRLHNDMLAHYGQPLIIDGRRAFAVIPDNNKYKELSELHLKPTSEVKWGKDGKTYRTFVVLRGSHEYNSKEMAVLIDGLIAEIKGSGAPIETMTPAELAQLKGYSHDK